MLHHKSETRTKMAECKAFLLLTVFLFPALSIALVGAYGFGIWFLQMFLIGPPSL